MSSDHARAVRTRSHPTSAGSPENPYPGSEGSTRWNASAALPPCAVGFVSGPTESSISMTEPGQPWVMISGSASWCSDLTCTKWMSMPSISVVNCGSAFSRDSTRRPSYSVAQYWRSACIVASCTPCERSPTSSLLGQRVDARRRRRSSSASSGISTVNGRMTLPVCCSSMVMSGTAPLLAPGAEKSQIRPGWQTPSQAAWRIWASRTPMSLATSGAARARETPWSMRG